MLVAVQIHSIRQGLPTHGHVAATGLSAQPLLSLPAKPLPAILTQRPKEESKRHPRSIILSAIFFLTVAN